MAEQDEKKVLQVAITQRVDAYHAEIQKIVSRGIEHPRYELKRSVSISRNNLADRLDFLKLIHGLANAHIAEERFIVVGADQKEMKFYDVTNPQEFDPATLSQILTKYLDPPPQFEVFNAMQSSDSKRYILIVLGAEQPRPIVAISEGKSDKKVHFEIGDIWVKKDTSLQRATKADLDAMYEKEIKKRVDEEAEPRARRRFEHFREEFGSTPMLQSTLIAPSPELLIGAKARLWRFAESAIASSDATRFKMLIEMARAGLIERWGTHQINGPGLPSDVNKWNSEISEFYRDEFLPSLDSVVDLALQIIKYDSLSEWVGLIIDNLVETFDRSRRFDRLKSAAISTIPDALLFARPAYDIYIGIRTIATYAVARKRFRFLKEILPRFVRFLTIDDQSDVLTPILFWPFSGIALPDMRQGRNLTLWNEHIQEAWGSYFGSFENFLGAASQLEFILEFNSYIFEGIQHPGIQKLRQTLGNKYFAYLPDFWTNRLDATVPVAELFYDLLRNNASIPQEFAVEKSAIDLVFQGKTPRERVVFLGGFLGYLHRWQSHAMRQQNRFPFMFEWDGRLKEIVTAHGPAEQK